MKHNWLGRFSRALSLPVPATYPPCNTPCLLRCRVCTCVPSTSPPSYVPDGELSSRVVVSRRETSCSHRRVRPASIPGSGYLGLDVIGNTANRGLTQLQTTDGITYDYVEVARLFELFLIRCKVYRNAATVSQESSLRWFYRDGRVQTISRFLFRVFKFSLLGDKLFLMER